MDTDLDFSDALVALKAGDRIARAGWNGKGMYLFLVGPKDWNIECWHLGDFKLTGELAPFVAMRTVDDKLVPWLASQTDLLADDWEILDG